MMSSDDLLSYELAEGEDPALLNEDDLLLSDDGKLRDIRVFLYTLCLCVGGNNSVRGNRFSVQSATGGCINNRVKFHTE